MKDCTNAYTWLVIRVQWMSRYWEVAIHQEGDDTEKSGRSMNWRKYAIRIRGNGLAQRIAPT